MLWGVFALGCVCFGWKSFPEMLFQKWGCLVGPENSIFRKLKSVDPKKQPLTTEMLLHFYFPFKAFPENERERERARTCARGEDPVRAHELQLQSDGAIDGEIAIAPSIAIRRDRDRDLGSRSPCRDHDRVVDRDRSVIAVSDCDRAVVPWSRSRIAIAPWSQSRIAPWLVAFLELMIFFF